MVTAMRVIRINVSKTIDKLKLVLASREMKLNIKAVLPTIDATTREVLIICPLVLSKIYLRGSCSIRSLMYAVCRLCISPNYYSIYKYFGDKFGQLIVFLTNWPKYLTGIQKERVEKLNP